MQFLTKVCWLAMTLCLGSVWSDTLAQSTTQPTAPSLTTAPASNFARPT